MQRVVTINLGGNAYQLDESAYDALRAYLDRAAAQLKDNPDRAEILADFEQAIAEKCGKFLGLAKTVVTAAEMQQIVAEMGPVDGAEPVVADAHTHESKTAPSDVPPPSDRRPAKRFYRIREGAMWAGVCNGLAAYFGIDVVIVRIIFAVLAAVSFGWGLLAYWALMFIIPEAQTAEERAAAYGEAPFNAQEIVDHAKRAAGDLKNAVGSTHQQWRREWRQQRRQWRAEHRAWRAQWRGRQGSWTPAGAWAPVPPAGYPPPILSSALMPIAGLINAVFAIAMVAAIVSIVNTGALFGWMLPAGLPVWGGILIVVIAFQILSAPFRALRHASYYGWPGHSLLVLWDGLIGTAIAVLAIWLLARHMTSVHDAHEFMQQLPEAFRGVGHDIQNWVRAIFR